jgi:AmmeMemoRadiSam system protein B
VADDGPHQREHSLEVQLPLLIRALGDVPVIPIAVGISPVDNIVETIEAATTAGGPGTVLVCSTDFSHYHDHTTAQQLDRRTAQAVLDLDPDQIGVRDACGVFALRGVVGWARQHKLTPELLDLRTSADTQGNPDRVVGYPAFAFH